jgi:hypothetical protein
MSFGVGSFFFFLFSFFSAIISSCNIMVENRKIILNYHLSCLSLLESNIAFISFKINNILFKVNCMLIKITKNITTAIRFKFSFIIFSPQGHRIDFTYNIIRNQSFQQSKLLHEILQLIMKTIGVKIYSIYSIRRHCGNFIIPSMVLILLILTFKQEAFMKAGETK